MIQLDQREKDAEMNAEKVNGRLAAGDYVLVSPAKKRKSEVWKSLERLIFAEMMMLRMLYFYFFARTSNSQ